MQSCCRPSVLYNKVCLIPFTEMKLTRFVSLQKITKKIKHWRLTDLSYTIKGSAYNCCYYVRNLGHKNTSGKKWLPGDWICSIFLYILWHFHMHCWPFEALPKNQSLVLRSYIEFISFSDKTNHYHITYSRYLPISTLVLFDTVKP